MSVPGIPFQRQASEQAAEIFCDALELPPSDRDRFVRGACPGPALENEVKSLLDAYAGSGHFLEPAEVARFAGWLASVDPGPREGETVGRWRLLRELGRGGMGTVYLGERTDGQFQQQVAVKLVRIGVAGRGLLSRFLRERRILARLQHPNIARLLDGGATEDGRPYFVMEYVDGLSITAYCDQQRLTTAARLALFLDVCEAVQCAHRNLVIHRDLKPGNILITNQRQVKLLDFGIAKLLEPDLGEGPITTDVWPRAMTPEYAAPEQMRGEPVTTATDVYSLGVVLYELLSSRRPYRFETRTLGNMVRILSEKDPVPPSLAGIQERGRLSADLDAIVLKALRREPDLRYQSVEAMGEDIRRFLAGMPVAARRGTMAYRVGRLVRRNRAAVLAGVLALVTLIAGAAGTAWQARRAARERDAALREADKAARVSSFMIELFRLAKPDLAQGREVTLREALDSGRVYIERDLATHPELRTEIQNRLADVYHALGLYRDAQQLWESALVSSLAQHGPVHLLVLRNMLDLTKVLSDLGLSDSAAALAHRSLAIWRQLPRLKDREFEATHILHRLADALRRQGRYPESEQVSRQALSILDPRHPESGHRRSVILTTLAHVVLARGDLAQAESVYREVLSLRRAFWGEVHPEVTNATINLAVATAERGDYAEAEALFERGLAWRQQLQGELHPDYGVDLRHLAALLRRKGERDSAATVYERALELQRQAFPPDHPHLIPTLVGLGGLLLERSQFAKGEVLLREAVRIGTAALRPGHPQLVEAQVALSLALASHEPPHTP